MSAPELTIIERDLRQYRADMDFAHRQLQTCAPDREPYWRDYGTAAARVVTELEALQRLQQQRGVQP